MSKLLTKMQWDLVEYNVEKMEFQKCDQVKISSPSLTHLETCVPLGSLLKKKPVNLKEGFIQERRAGDYIERKSKKIKSGGSRIIKLKHETLWDGEVVKPFYRLRDFCDVNNYGAFVLSESINVMKENDSRLANPKQVLKSCNNFKWLIRANERDCRLFVTLTYAENMTDTKRLYEDFRRFWQRLKYEYPILSGYLVAFEPQKRGAWHAHVLLLCRKKKFIFIPNKKMRKIWGFGFTKTQKINNIHDLGAYVTSYLTNLKEGNEKSKKGQRLYLYPKGFRFLRHSSDIEKQTISKWYGDISKVDWNPLEYELIYDYLNEYSYYDETQLLHVSCLRLKPGGKK